MVTRARALVGSSVLSTIEKSTCHSKNWIQNFCGSLRRPTDASTFLLWTIQNSDARKSEFCIDHNRKVDMYFQQLNSKCLLLLKEADGRADFAIVDNAALRRARVGVL